ncbi:MAG TPA: hypothetical protein VN493_26005 [Thermoanaerobaculia bacterium]|nr:hypothetical protein [Thermoanaerobaculia bacterium]
MKRFKGLQGLQAVALLCLAASAHAQPRPVPEAWFVNALSDSYPVHFSVTDATERAGESHPKKAWFGWVWSEGADEKDWPELYPGTKAFNLLDTLSDNARKVVSKRAEAKDLGFPALGVGPGDELWLLVGQREELGRARDWERLLDTVESAYRQVVAPGSAGASPHAYRSIGKLGLCDIWSAPLPETGSLGEWQPHQLNQAAPEAVDDDSYEGVSGAAKSVKVRRFLRWLEGCSIEKMEKSRKEIDLQLFPIFNQPDKYFLEIRKVTAESLGWREIDPTGWTSGIRTKASLPNLPSAQVPQEVDLGELSDNLCQNDKLAKFCEDEQEVRQRLYIFRQEVDVPSPPRTNLLQACRDALNRDCQGGRFAESTDLGPYRRTYEGPWMISSEPSIQSEMVKGKIRWSIPSGAEVKVGEAQLLRIENKPIPLLVISTPLWKRPWAWALVALTLGGVGLLVHRKKRSRTRRDSGNVDPNVGDNQAAAFVKPAQASPDEGSETKTASGCAQQILDEAHQVDLEALPPQPPKPDEDGLEALDAKPRATSEEVSKSNNQPALMDDQAPTDVVSAQSPTVETSVEIASVEGEEEAGGLQAQMSAHGQILSDRRPLPGGEGKARDVIAAEGLQETTFWKYMSSAARQALDKIKQPQRDLETQDTLLRQASEMLDAKLVMLRSQLFTEFTKSPELEQWLVSLKDEHRQDFNLEEALGKIRDAGTKSAQTARDAFNNTASALATLQDTTVRRTTEFQETVLATVATHKDELLSSVLETLQAELSGLAVTAVNEARGSILEDLRQDLNIQEALGGIRDAGTKSAQTARDAFNNTASALATLQDTTVRRTTEFQETVLATVATQKDELLSSVRETLQAELSGLAVTAINEARDTILEDLRKETQNEISQAVDERWKRYAGFFEQTAPMFEDKARLEQLLEALLIFEKVPQLATAIAELSRQLPFEGLLSAVAPDHLNLLEDSRRLADEHGRAEYGQIRQEIERLEPRETKESFQKGVESLGQLGFWIRSIWSALRPLGTLRDIVDPLPEVARQEWLGAFRCLRSFELVDAPTFRRLARGIRNEESVTEAELSFLRSCGISGTADPVLSRLQTYLICRGEPGRLGEVGLALQYLIEAFPREHIAEKARRGAFEQGLRTILTSASLPTDLHALIASAAEGVGFRYRPVPYYRSRVDDSRFDFIGRLIGAIDLAERVGFVVDLEPYTIVRLDCPFFFVARDGVYYSGRACIARQ